MYLNEVKLQNIPHHPSCSQIPQDDPHPRNAARFSCCPFPPLFFSNKKIRCSIIWINCFAVKNAVRFDKQIWHGFAKIILVMCCVTFPPIIMGSVENWVPSILQDDFSFIYIFYIGGFSVFMMGERVVLSFPVSSILGVKHWSSNRSNWTESCLSRLVSDRIDLPNLYR